MMNPVIEKETSGQQQSGKVHLTLKLPLPSSGAGDSVPCPHCRYSNPLSRIHTLQNVQAIYCKRCGRLVPLHDHK
jgi:hypothetical protein